jgi:hypothetical protein
MKIVAEHRTWDLRRGLGSRSSGTRVGPYEIIGHPQHHAARLTDRLREAQDLGLRWKGGSRPA